MKSSLSKRKGSKALAKIVSAGGGGRVLGVHFVGPEAAEIVQASIKQNQINSEGPYSGASSSLRSLCRLAKLVSVLLS